MSSRPPVNTACPVCAVAGIPMGNRNGYRILRCASCRHLYCADQPSSAEIAGQYERYSYDRSGLSTVPPFVLARLAELLRPLLVPGGRNRLLDVGFGAGALLTVAAQLGFEATGIELSALAVEQARRSGLQVTQGDFGRAEWEPASFDVVCMFELLEHLPTPVEFLAAARGVLRPGGVLMLTTPNGDGLSGRVLGVRWSAVAPPEHLQLFSPRSMGIALRRAGFGSHQTRCEGLNPYELAVHLGRPGGSAAAGGATRPVPSTQALNEKVVARRGGRALKRAANAVLTLLRLGDSLKTRAWAD